MAVVDGIIANGVTEILKKLSSVVVNEITLVWDFNDELKNLKDTLNMIMDVIEVAEKKQLSSKAVRRWMEELKAIAYDAEDILDEYSYEVIRCKHQQKDEEYNKSTVFSKVRNVLISCTKPSFVVSWKLAHKVQKINKKFNKLAKLKNDMGLQRIEAGSSSSSSQHELMMKNRKTNSLVVTDWKFVGRENDKSTIIKMLLEEEEEEENSSNNQSGGSKNVSVIPIVGMGGLGKTTMAQQVYNDEAVQKHFQLKIWICVSDSFDIKKLWEEIATLIKIDKADIARSLQNAFRGKKFILVLDDVWNENLADWNKFKNPFMDGGKGSKILVTTRKENVALAMLDKIEPYRLDILKENVCWSLFEEIAFGCPAAGAIASPKLVEIGKDMVKRCGGLPLAVVFLGSLMRSKKTEKEWKIIQDTKLWHESREGKNSEILPSLRISYDYLPSHLKLCFSYCCLFPKDLKINRERLIRLWMAEGFLIESPEENAMSMQEIGNEYFHSLLSSFFFQDVEKDDDGDVLRCKMHDIVHDLARSVVGNHECLIVENAPAIEYISEETRRLNLLVNLDDEEMLPKVLEALKRAKNLRTVFVINQQKIGFDIGNAFKENKRLRVLDLFVRSTTESISSSIGGFKHLRYLNVYGVLFPKGIGRLSFLQTLSNFRVGDDKKKKWNAGGIEELECLKLLTGDLTIFGLENVTSGTKACRANLKEKNLRGLNLCWDRRVPADINHEEEAAVLEGLRPHPNLRTLKIEGFQGSKLPRWIQENSSSCLSNLVELTLYNINCEQVVGFGALPSLRSLNLWRVNKVNKLKCTGEASTTTTIAFPSLKKLTLRFMDSLKEWVVPVLSTTTTIFPLLEEIEIIYCHRLSTITPTTTIFPSLKVLYLHCLDARAVDTLVTNNLNSLTSLTLFEMPNLITLPVQGLMENNNTLLSLEIMGCQKFEGFFPPSNNEEEEEEEEEEEGHNQGGGGQQISSNSSSSLQSLKLYSCPAMRFYPNILRSLTSLRSLEIQYCKISKSLQDELTRLSSSLEHLEHVQILNNKTATEVEEEDLEEAKE